MGAIFLFFSPSKPKCLLPIEWHSEKSLLNGGLDVDAAQCAGRSWVAQSCFNHRSPSPTHRPTLSPQCCLLARFHFQWYFFNILFLYPLPFKYLRWLFYPMMLPCTCMVDASAPAFCSSDFAQQGRVRTKTVKRVSREIIEKYYTRLTLDFHTNKRICDEIAQIPSKKLRNKIAGFITHLMKRIQVRTAHFNQPPFNTFSFHSFKKISFLNMGWRWCATCPINAIATVCVHDGSLVRLACAMPMFCRFVAALASNL